ncbi:hypothetical protein SNE40_010226 [Patella caerulea]|uniref:Homeobox domain-containing protein n=1 Tax=Patella caerulea TaxID=87958 RepID=A0AAN8JSY0_PATCE
MAVKTNKEITSFKLLEEEPSEMKPTPAMKKFVGMVLDKKDMKDREVACSFRNLTEYRDPVSSPPVCVSNGLSFEPNGFDSDSPVSPGPVQMDDDRLPNELLDEICEDIGMKEGMELDFVEFLMEQDDMDPQTYMTPEALTTGLYTPAFSNHKIVNLPSGPGSDSGSVTGIKPLEQGTPNKSIPVSIPNTTSTITSSASSSPASKRFHMSTSEQNSPAKSCSSQSSVNQVFKMPQTPPTPKRPHSASQILPSPSLPTGTHSTTSVSYSQGQIATKRCYSPSPLSSCSQQQIATKKAQVPPQSPTSKQPGTLHYGQTCQITSPRPACPAPQKQVINSQQGFQRLGKPAPPVVNVQTFQQQRWMQQQNIQGYNNDPAAASQYSKVDSPLDHGYYSSDSVNRGQPTSTAASGYTLSSMTEQPSMYNMKRSDSTSNLSAMSVGSQSSQTCRQQSSIQQQQQQKSVHFAEGSPQGSPDCQDTSQMQNYAQGYDAPADCASYDLEQEFRDNSQKPMQSKMLPRLSNVKPEIAPYTVPNPGQQPLPYDHQRSSCSVSQTGNGSSRTQSSMQTFDYSGKNADNMYYMDNNQNMMRIETGDYSSGNYQANYNNGGMTDQMKAVMAGLQDNEMYKNQPSDIASSTSQGYNNSCSMPGMNQGANAMMSNQMGQNYNQSSNYPSPCVNPHMMNANTNSMPGQYQNMSSQQQQFDQAPYCQSRQQGSMATPIYSNNVNQSNMGQGNQWMGAPQTPQNMQMQQMQMSNKTPMGVQHMGGMAGAGGQPMPHGAQAMPPQAMTPGGVPHMQPCTIPNCTSCKTGSPNRPPMLASQQSFIQHLITDRSNAFRSHPLFPLLRDLIIADMNFSSPNFPYQLISNLPADFDKLLQNFLQRNPPTGNYQGNYAVESVIMDALRYAHQCIIEKIRMRQDQDKHTKTTSKSLSAIEEFCEKFDRAVRNTVPGQPSPNDGNPMMLPPGGDMSGMMGGPPGGVLSGVPPMVKEPKYMMDPNMQHPGYVSPGMGKVLGMPGMGPSQYEMMKQMSDSGSTYSNSSGLINKAESKKHPSLPKEAVAMMLDWLRNHKDNPYPNDDEKAMLIKQTGLTINQINYWFTNARRRILPKWAQCK